MLVQFKNDSGMVKSVKVGVSWTVFFFGPFPFIFRGLIGHFFLWLFITLITSGLAGIYLMFAINKMTAVYYLEHGYKQTGEGWNVAAVKWQIAST